MTREILTAAIAALRDNSVNLSTAWQSGNEVEIAQTIKTIRYILNDTERMLKNDLRERLTSTPTN